MTAIITTPNAAAGFAIGGTTGLICNDTGRSARATIGSAASATILTIVSVTCSRLPFLTPA